jgi:hypothetical protein
MCLHMVDAWSLSIYEQSHKDHLEEIAPTDEWTSPSNREALCRVESDSKRAHHTGPTGNSHQVRLVAG